ncbi:MAG TPA: IgGFc-binding protein, partial [Nannocystis sp.]
RGANQITQTTVAPNSVKLIQLPYVNQLVKPTINEAGPSLVVPDGAYRLRSNQPVTVYQYEPLDYVSGGLFSFTNDASLLLPVNTWTGNYIVAARNTWVANGFYNLPGFYAVVARFDNTQVTLTPSTTGKIVQAGGGVAANGSGVVTLNEGDVLEVFSAIGGGIPDASDLTGTIISANKPVEVFGGHKCTQVPVGTQACDRLEEAMLPIETLAKEYIVTPPLIPTGGNVPKAQMVRVIATEANTTISYDPPQPAPTMLANPGDYFEIAKTAADFKITADKKILVSQYMQGQDAGGNSGDPAMALAVATDQYRTKYLVHAPTNYESNYANIVAPMGASITLDGAPVANFTAIGGTGYGVARVKLNNNVDGNHDLSGDVPFGVHIYGYGQYTSYWYPGGLDLKVIPQ